MAEYINDTLFSKTLYFFFLPIVVFFFNLQKIVQADRRKRGITPHLPPYYERPQAMEEYRDVLAQIQGQKSSGSCVIQ